MSSSVRNNHGHSLGHPDGARAFLRPAISLVLLAAGMLMSHLGFAPFADRRVELGWYILAFLPVGFPVVREAIQGMARRDVFNEFTLMTIACFGAFCIGEYPEAVGVMLFYSVGETLQHGAVKRATGNIARLLDVRGDKAYVLRDGKAVATDPREVGIGDIIQVSPGGRVPLDGTLVGGSALFDTSALTGESVPREIAEGGEVLAGMISSQRSVDIRVSRAYSDSALARILDMVANASSRKAHAELFMSKFARIYTPVVIALAVLVVVVPAIIGALDSGFRFEFDTWLYRALVFLVISCPCALVISIPLGYYAGIGAASRAGILFKGGNYLESITKVGVVAFDKTGTLTTGTFSVSGVEALGMDEAEMLSLMASAESASTHPLAVALVDYVRERGIAIPSPDSMTERPGYGTNAVVGGRKVLAGSLKMLKADGLDYPEDIGDADGTLIACAVDGRYAGYAVLSDTVKPDAAEAVADLRRLGIGRVVMLSGDRQEIVSRYAARLGISEAYGGLLPQDKADFVEKVRSESGSRVAFVGDGMNDAPVLALSDVGIAMGGLGSDAAIESADVVIQTDRPSKVATAIRIGRTTHAIVTENIVGAIGIKAVILLLGALGYASLWAAVFADVGVALLAVLNSMRILRKSYA